MTAMPDRAKVMKWLKICVNGCEDGCPYEYKNLVYRVECKADLMADALDLLWEQEPVRFKVTQQCRSYPFWDAECGGCGYKTSTIHRNWKYCPECGREVKWE